MAQIISLFSSKGGVGRTFIATNLAASLAKRLSNKILLLDIDLHLPGDMARVLNLKPKKSLANLIPEWQKDKYDSSKLGDYITKYSKGGFDLVSTILTSKEVPLIDPKCIASVLSDLAKQYEFIIIDAGRSFSKLLISIIEQSNLLLILANPDVLSVYQAKEAVDILQSFYFPLKMMKTVLNRAESQGGVSWREVKEAIPCDIIARIPSEGKIVGSSLNRRIPVVLDNPRCRVSLALEKLAENLLTNTDLFISHRELATIFSVHPLTADDASLGQQPTSLEELSLKHKPFIEKKESQEDKIDALKIRVHKHIIQELDLRKLDNIIGDVTKIDDLRQKTMKVISNALTQEAGALITSREERERLIKEITDEALGFGPLEDLINDPEVTDILVNNKNQIYVERRGKLEATNKRFISNQQVRQIIERIIAPLGRRVDESVPMVDARLTDGSRVNAIIPPLSLSGPTLTIRKFGTERLEISDLVKFDTLNDTMSEFIKACVLARKNIIVSGATGSGKTTVLNVLSEFIPDNERIITIEDAAELKLHHQHWVRLESRPPNIEGRGEISTRDLFRNSLRMRPDRIIIGECRGSESLDMLQAMNTGHDGSMTTIHANSTQDVLSRLDSLILMSGIEIPLRAIREMIASAIDMIVHTARLSDGTRKIIQITEITGLLDEMHIGLKDIYIFSQLSVDEKGRISGEFKPTGILPTFFEEFQKRGIGLSKTIFKAK